MTALKDICQTMRTVIAVRSTAAATAKYRPRAAGSRLARMGRMQPYEYEGQHVQHEDDGFPHGVRRNPDPRGRTLRRGSRDGNRIAHHGEDA
jgi:hypothetical protein